MSKSKGEFLTITLLEEKGYDPLAYRFACLQSHYRKVLTFSFDALDNANKAYQKLKNKISSLKEGGTIDETSAKEYLNKFKDALENDLNTSLALTTLYDALKADLSDATKIYLVKEMDKVLSLNLLNDNKKDLNTNLEGYIKEKIAERDSAKKEKNFTLADSIRDELKAKGIIIKDTREGTIYEIL